MTTKTSCTVPCITAAHARPARSVAVRQLSRMLAFVLVTSVGAAIHVFPDARAETPPGHIEVTSFAGDTVHATVWNQADKKRHAIRVHPRALVGLTWTVTACEGGRCESVTSRIAAVVQDTSRNTMPEHGDNSDVWLYRVEYALASAPGQWQPACERGDAGAVGIFVDGQWSEDGAWQPGGWTFSCLDGVIAKCARSWGYKPWKTLRTPVHGDVDLQPLHQACTRAARADYCGDGASHTQDGTPVDMFDVYGLNVRDQVSEFREESTFGEHGALSVSVPRWPAATPTATGWRFSTCERPRQAPSRAGTPLIHVWSDPGKGRDVAVR